MSPSVLVSGAQHLERDRIGFRKRLLQLFTDCIATVPVDGNGLLHAAVGGAWRRLCQ
jgi:hypothetical protein